MNDKSSGYGSGSSGSDTGSGSSGSTSSIQQNWDTPISQLQNNLKDSNYQDYVMIGRDSTGKLHIVGDNQKVGTELFEQAQQAF
jgi:hypothetical protein